MPRFTDATHTIEFQRFGDDEPEVGEYTLIEIRRPDLVEPVRIATLGSVHVTFVEGDPDA